MNDWRTRLALARDGVLLVAALAVIAGLLLFLAYVLSTIAG